MILHGLGALEVLQILIERAGGSIEIDMDEVRERPPVILEVDGTKLRLVFHNSLLTMPVEGTA